MAQDFVKEGGNVFRKQVGGERPIEINLLLSRLDHSQGMRQRAVEGVGQVNTLPELSWVMLDEPDLRSFRKDSARILHELASTVTRSSAVYPVPAHLDRTHLAALIKRYVTRVK